MKPIRRPTVLCRLAWASIPLAAAGIAVGGEISRELKPPVRIEANGSPIDTGGIGYAAPFYADFDGDGTRDLLVGEFSQGRMRVFSNHGTDHEPDFKNHEFFHAGGALGTVPSG
ncbi:MAG TPA: hypothetical protein VML55_17045 [Planctomycetaceae bacterium]|nr:hypothetical protein [Planctomycetaceae bacterium]